MGLFSCGCLPWGAKKDDMLGVVQSSPPAAGRASSLDASGRGSHPPSARVSGEAGTQVSGPAAAPTRTGQPAAPARSISGARGSSAGAVPSGAPGGSGPLHRLSGGDRGGQGGAGGEAYQGAPHSPGTTPVAQLEHSQVDSDAEGSFTYKPAYRPVGQGLKAPAPHAQLSPLAGQLPHHAPLAPLPALGKRPLPGLSQARGSAPVLSQSRGSSPGVSRNSSMNGGVGGMIPGSLPSLTHAGKHAPSLPSHPLDASPGSAPQPTSRFAQQQQQQHHLAPPTPMPNQQLHGQQTQPQQPPHTLRPLLRPGQAPDGPAEPGAPLRGQGQGQLGRQGSWKDAGFAQLSSGHERALERLSSGHGTAGPGLGGMAQPPGPSSLKGPPPPATASAGGGGGSGAGATAAPGVGQSPPGPRAPVLGGDGPQGPGGAAGPAAGGPPTPPRPMTPAMQRKQAARANEDLLSGLVGGKRGVDYGAVQGGGGAAAELERFDRVQDAMGRLNDLLAAPPPTAALGRNRQGAQGGGSGLGRTDNPESDFPGAAPVARGVPVQVTPW